MNPEVTTAIALSKQGIFFEKKGEKGKRAKERKEEERRKEKAKK